MIAASATTALATDTAEAAATGWSWEAGPEQIDSSQIVATYEHEFVVVGAGIAGLSTACSIAENGGDVIVVEKEPTWSARGFHFGSLNTPRWVEAGITNDKFDVYRDWDAQCNSRMRPELVWTFLNRSGEALEWMFQKAESYGASVHLLGTHYFGEFYPEYYGTCMLYPDEHMQELAGDIDISMSGVPHFALYQNSLENGATYVWSTPAKQLVLDEDGCVTGVICTNTNGEYEQYNATKGVVLATGDCSGDAEMSACFSPLMNRCLSSQYTPLGANTGDGQKMAIWAGAKMQDAPWPPMIHPQGYGMFLGPFMCVNSTGKRFMNEDTWTQGKSLGILEQPGNVDYGFCVFDSNYSDDLYNTRKIGGGLMWDSVWREYGDEGTCEDYNEAVMEMCVNMGCLYQGDTIEEAAAAVQADYPTFDADLFVAQVARYNELVEAGYDEDFGKRADLMLPVAQAPFYIEKVGPNKMCCPGGAMITGFGQVIDEDDKPIEGLYAVGNVSGGLYAVDYPLVINGNSHGRCVTFGYLLGRQLTGVEQPE
jgi:succinate dehydrogenase/fumarate reductase flavoprotein subunit